MLRREEEDQINFIDLRFERWQVVRFTKARSEVLRGEEDQIMFIDLTK